jgi:hypothetical protein
MEAGQTAAFTVFADDISGLREGDYCVACKRIRIVAGRNGRLTVRLTPENAGLRLASDHPDLRPNEPFPVTAGQEVTVLVMTEGPSAVRSFELSTAFIADWLTRVLPFSKITVADRFWGGFDGTTSTLRCYRGSRVEVIDARVGTVATTDEHGHYYMPGTFTGTITLMASKDGYVSQTRTWTPPPLRAPGPPVVEFKGSVSFYLELPGQSPADIAGVYTLTLTADRACTSLPTEARTRTYTATMSV